MRQVAWVAVVWMSIIGPAASGPSRGAGSAWECAELMEQALDTVATNHWSAEVRARAAASDVPRRVCAASRGDVMAAAREVAIALGDPAIRVVTRQHFDRTLAEWDGVPRVGIGLSEVLSIDTDEATGRLTIILPVPGSPASAGGLRTGDVVTAIDGVSTDSLGLGRSMDALRVEAGRSVRLSVLRNDEEREVRLTSEALPALEPLRVERGLRAGLDVLFVRLRRFTPGVAEELRTVIEASRDADLILLDLRENPGGRLDEALGVAGAFLPDGSALARVAGVNSATLRSAGDPLGEVPLAVLVGEGTASAAELLAGALRFNGRARIYGAQTFGKGLVHRAVSLVENEWVLLLPVARLETPEGRPILHYGLAPDVRTVNPVDEALRDAVGS